MDIPRITRIKIPTLHIEDFLVWLPDKYGKFTVQSTYRFAVKYENNKCSKSSSFKFPIPKKY